MHLSRTRLSVMAAVAALFSTVAMNAAQEATFHLPVAAYWGTTLLQPGDYKMILPAISLGEPRVQVRGEHCRVYALPAVTDFQETSDSSRLVLSQVNGEYFVREFSSGPTGKMFHFTLPKSVRNQQIAERQGSDTSVAVN